MPTSSHESTIADSIPAPNSKVHAIFDYHWLRPRTNRAWQPWEDQHLIDSKLRGIPNPVTASYLSAQRVKRTKTDCRYRVKFHTDRAAGAKLLLICWTGHGRKFSQKEGIVVVERLLKKKGAFDPDVLKFAVERIMKKRASRKREQASWKYY